MIASVTTTMKDSRGDPLWWAVEFPGLKSIDEVHEVLANDGVLKGQKLILERIQDRDPRRRITSRQPVIIGINVVATITLPHITIVE